MEDLILVTPHLGLQEQYICFINDSKDDIQRCNMGYYMPFSDTQSFSDDVRRLNNHALGLDLPEGWVPESTYWLWNKNTDRIVGVTTIRHRLAGYLFFRGGHISYYIRPSERRKGYATQMLRLALELCKGMGIDNVMITCAKNNTGSARTIQKNGGVLHSEDVENDEVFQRYWIEIGNVPITYDDLEKALPTKELHRLFQIAGWSDGTESHDMIERFNLPFVNSTLVISAWSGQRLVGFVRVLSDQIVRSVLHDLIVDPQYQGRRIGKTLVRKCIEHFPDTEWLVQTTSKTANFYEQLGFKKFEEEVLALPSKWER